MQWQKEGDTKERETVAEGANNVKAVIGEKKRIGGFNLYVQVCSTR